MSSPRRCWRKSEASPCPALLIGPPPRAKSGCYHVGTILGGLVPPVVTYFALNYNLGFSIPMLIGCLIGGASWCLALFLGPETKGKEMVPDLVLA